VTSTITYFAFVQRIPGVDFRARFPDFPEVWTTDTAIEDIAARGSQLLRAHIDELLQADEGVPRPIPLDAIKDDERYHCGFLVKVEVEVPEHRLYEPSRG